ncbi:MAG: DNA cytosine methyltransferase [Prevotella sp.]
MLGWENLFHCEINPFGRKVLDYWYPNAKSYEDITTTDFTEWRGRVDVLTGGFPCQPFSYAGRRRGSEDDRYLWPAMYRAIDEIQPTWVVAENVAGILTMVEQGKVSEVASQATLFGEGDTLHRYQLRETFTLERICTDLESHGYAVQPVLIPACAVGAPHRRDRVFIVARRIASDTNDRADRRTAREDEGKGREERIQERHEVRKSDEPNQVRREGERIAAADTISSREGTSRASGESESSRGDTHQQPSERGSATERLDILHAILRPSADSGQSRPESVRRERQDAIHRPRPIADAGSCGQSASELESERERTDVQQQGGEQSFDGIGRPSATRLAPHPDSHRGCEVDEHMESKLEDGAKPVSNGGQRNVADTCHAGLQEARPEQPTAGNRGFGVRTGEWVERFGRGEEIGSRWANFPSVSPIHRGNDGLPFDVDSLTLSFGKWRTEALKAYGNAILPQVMYEIFRAIEIVEQ